MKPEQIEELLVECAVVALYDCSTTTEERNSLIDRLATAVRELREDAALLQRFKLCFERGLYKPYKDHACADCEGTIPKDGFQCAYHELLDTARGEHG